MCNLFHVQKSVFWHYSDVQLPINVLTSICSHYLNPACNDFRTNRKRLPCTHIGWCKHDRENLRLLNLIYLSTCTSKWNGCYFHGKEFVFLFLFFLHRAKWVAETQELIRKCGEVYGTEWWREHLHFLCSILNEIKFLFSFFSQMLDKDTQELIRKTREVCDWMQLGETLFSIS